MQHMAIGMATANESLRRRPVHWYFAAAALALLFILAAELLLSIRHLSVTMDEGAHLYAGYQYWRAQDFGLNPEHPPLVKLVAAAPLMGLHLQQPHPPRIFYLAEEYDGGNQLLTWNDGDLLLMRARTAASLFTFALALCLSAAGFEMFGAPVALLALALFVFEPTLLAHGALITTDMGAACWVFASIYAFYRYTKCPGMGRLLLCGCAVGLAFAAKISGVLAIPILVVCARVAFVSSQKSSPATDRKKAERKALKLVGALAAICLVSYLVLWAFYAFRYAARPGNLALAPSLQTYATALPRPIETWVIQFMAKWHLLPEGYLFAWTKRILEDNGHPGFLLGKVYPAGTWLYFPVALLIKSSLPLLLLLAAAPLMYYRSLKPFRREVFFLLSGMLIILAAGMTSHLNIGVRHMLPFYPFAILLAAATAWALAKTSRLAAWVVGAMLVFQAVSSLHAYPDYLTYGNEAFGGPSKTYHWLADSNVDWSQQLKEVRTYIEAHHIRDCWLAYNTLFPLPDTYRIPCKQLPTGVAMWTGMPEPIIPRTITGTILVDAMDASGVIWGPGDLNPYRQFQDGRPADMIGNSMLVYRGTYDVPLASAQSHASQVPGMLRRKQADAALAEARTAVNLAPDSAELKAVLGGTLLQIGRTSEAEQTFSEALRAARAHASDDEAASVNRMIDRYRSPAF